MITKFKVPVRVMALLIPVVLTFSACGLFSDSGSAPAPVRVHEDIIEEPTLSVEESAGYGQLPVHPIFDFKGTGNFKDIDSEVWKAHPSYDPKNFVGKWYEDGFTNGYYLEMYGDGTWQLFTDTVLKGYYTVWENGVINFEEGAYGITLGQADVRGAGADYGDPSEPLTMYLSFYLDSLTNFRATDGKVTLMRVWDSTYKEDIEDYYREMYPFTDQSGTWYSVGEEEAVNFFEIISSGNWGEEQEGQGMLEVGLLEEEVDGKYTCTGANWGDEYVFEFADDGYLYVNGKQYEKREGEDLRYRYIVDKWDYYDEETGTYSGAYEFFDDLTFKTLPGNPKQTSGVYFYLDENLLLYDYNGYQVDRFWQDINFARRKTMFDKDERDLWGEGPIIAR